MRVQFNYQYLLGYPGMNSESFPRNSFTMRVVVWVPLILKCRKTLMWRLMNRFIVGFILSCATRARIRRRWLPYLDFCSQKKKSSGTPFVTNSHALRQPHRMFAFSLVRSMCCISLGIRALIARDICVIVTVLVCKVKIKSHNSGYFSNYL